MISAILAAALSSAEKRCAQLAKTNVVLGLLWKKVVNCTRHHANFNVLRLDNVCCRSMPYIANLQIKEKENTLWLLDV
jgi:hypothetical protein